MYFFVHWWINFVLYKFQPISSPPQSEIFRWWTLHENFEFSRILKNLHLDNWLKISRNLESSLSLLLESLLIFLMKLHHIQTREAKKHTYWYLTPWWQKFRFLAPPLQCFRDTLGFQSRIRSSKSISEEKKQTYT